MFIKFGKIYLYFDEIYAWLELKIIQKYPEKAYENNFIAPRYLSCYTLFGF